MNVQKYGKLAERFAVGLAEDPESLMDNAKYYAHQAEQAVMGILDRWKMRRMISMLMYSSSNDLEIAIIFTVVSYPFLYASLINSMAAGS